MDIVALTQKAHATFEVDLTVKRGEFFHEITGVLHLNAEMWEGGTGFQVVTRDDAVSVRAEVFTLERDDLVTCEDESVVPARATWKVTTLTPDGDDRFVKTWKMKKVDQK